MKHSKPNTSQARILSIILLALKTKAFILPRWMWRLQYNTSIGTSFCIEASVKAQRSSKIRPWNFLRHRPYRPAPHITRTMASRYDPPSPSILFCRSKLDERQTRSTFPTKIGARGLVGWQDVAPWRWKRTTPGISWFLRQLSLSAHQPCSFARVEQYQSIGRCANDYLALSQLGTLRMHFFTLDNQKQKVGFAKIFSSLGSESFPHFFHDDF